VDNRSCCVCKGRGDKWWQSPFFLLRGVVSQGVVWLVSDVSTVLLQTQWYRSTVHCTSTVKFVPPSTFDELNNMTSSMKVKPFEARRFWTIGRTDNACKITNVVIRVNVYCTVFIFFCYFGNVIKKIKYLLKISKVVLSIRIFNLWTFSFHIIINHQLDIPVCCTILYPIKLIKIDSHHTSFKNTLMLNVAIDRVIHCCGCWCC
jgi:hypothetical protein